MNEGLQKNETNEENKFSKNIKFIVSSCVAEINELKSKSIRPKRYDLLIDEIKSEGSFALLRQEGIIQAHLKDSDNLLPEVKEKIDLYFKKISDILDKYGKLLESTSDIKPLEVFQEENLKFKVIIKKIDEFGVEIESQTLKDLIKEIKINYNESMMKLYEESERKSKNISLLYENFLNDIREDIALQLKNISKNNKVESVLTFEANLDINQLFDSFITNSKKKVDKARDFYITEQAERN